MSHECSALQAQLAARNTSKPPSDSSTVSKSKSKRKMSESKECIVEAPVAKKEQAKPKSMKDKGNKMIF